MSHGYRLISWTPYKKRYDAILVGAIGAYLAVFFLVAKLVHAGDHAISDEILLMRATSTCAFILLNVILCIGPMARLNPRFLPILYNRRHLGVTMFLVALLHAAIAIGFYHGFGVVWPIRSLLTSNTQYRSISAFPFEILGLPALLILFVMAATSHDFWLNTLAPAVWKGIHMLVYPAWALIVLHVALGALQAELNVVYAILLFIVIVMVPALHLISGRREVKRDAQPDRGTRWIDAGAVDELNENRGKVLAIPGAERIALFRYGECVSAISNLCAHQNGPLGEGRMIDGCITCPWHGFQYRAQDGCAPPPFTEKLPTYAVKIESGRVLVNTQPLPPGTFVEPARIDHCEAVHV